MIVDMDKLEMAKKEINNAGLKGERAMKRLKMIEKTMNRLAERNNEVKSASKNTKKE